MMSIASEITRINNAKASIKASIENKGVAVPSGTLIDGYSSLIDTIPTGITIPYLESYTLNDWGRPVTIKIKEGVQTIGTNAYYTERTLTSVTLPNSVEVVGDAAFFGTYVRDINFPDSLTTIGNSAFTSCIYLATVDLPQSVKSIGYSAFRGMSRLTSITFPDNVEFFGTSVLSGCSSLTSVTFPNNLTQIPDNSCRGCVALTSATIPTGVTRIGEYAFYQNSFSAITLPNGLMTIAANAFNRCAKLKEIDLPQSVNNIGNYAFSACTGLESITIRAEYTPSLGTNAFGNTNNCPIYVPSESLETYKTAVGWSAYASRMQAIPST